MLALIISLISSFLAGFFWGHQDVYALHATMACERLVKTSQVQKKPNTTEAHYKLLNITDQRPGVEMQYLHPSLDHAGLDAVKAFKKVLGDDYRPTITNINEDHFFMRCDEPSQCKGAALDFRLDDILTEEKQYEVYKLAKRYLRGGYEVQYGFNRIHIHMW